jgi:hypothetical protein
MEKLLAIFNFWKQWRIQEFLQQSRLVKKKSIKIVD